MFCIAFLVVIGSTTSVGEERALFFGYLLLVIIIVTIDIFSIKKYHFYSLQCCCILHRHVCVMTYLRRQPCPGIFKTFKIFSRIRSAVVLKLCMHLRGPKIYEVYKSNNDPGLTLTYFTAWSNLVTYAFE